MVYLILSGIVFTAFLLRNHSKRLQVIPYVMLSLFAALRYGFGNDYFSYERNFHAIRLQGEGPVDEPLFVWLNEICPDFYCLVAITSVIFVAAVYRFVYKYVDSRYMWISVLIFVINPYLFLMNLSAIRQGLAIAMLLLAVPYAIERKPFRYCLLILLAFCFHKSAILLLPLYLVSDRRVSGKRMCAICGAVLLVLAIPDLSAVLRPFVLLWRDANYLHYFETSGTNSLRATLLTALYFVYVLGNMHRLSGSNRVCGKLYLAGTVLGIWAFKLSLFTRLQMYFDIFSVVALPAILQEQREAGPVEIDSRHVVRSAWNCLNRFVFPILLLIVYLLRAYSFFVHPRWVSFTEYRTVFELL